METMGTHVDGLKFAGGSFALMPEGRVREMIEVAHRNGVYVSTVSDVLSWGSAKKTDTDDREGRIYRAYSNPCGCAYCGG